ncbi:hypothetical protein [Streptomyces erythrochromogenes]|uniref:hypothetical protein n=1 Tax=Streptomyces erythrochromogenes TaxID=285574 RepID=UPI0002FAA424
MRHAGSGKAVADDAFADLDVAIVEERRFGELAEVFAATGAPAAVFQPSPSDR